MFSTPRRPRLFNRPRPVYYGLCANLATGAIDSPITEVVFLFHRRTPPRPCRSPRRPRCVFCSTPRLPEEAPTPNAFHHPPRWEKKPAAWGRPGFPRTGQVALIVHRPLGKYVRRPGTNLKTFPDRPSSYSTQSNTDYDSPAILPQTKANPPVPTGFAIRPRVTTTRKMAVKKACPPAQPPVPGFQPTRPAALVDNPRSRLDPPPSARGRLVVAVPSDIKPWRRPLPCPCRSSNEHRRQQTKGAKHCSNDPQLLRRP